MNRTSRFVLSSLVAIMGCSCHSAKYPENDSPARVVFEAALREDANGDARTAARLYVTALGAAAGAAGDPWSLATVSASLNALVERNDGPLTEFATGSSLTDRLADAPPSDPPNETIAASLERIYAEASTPFASALIAHALEVLAAKQGEAPVAERWRTAGSCAREATVIGPLSGSTITAVHDEDVLARFDAPLPEAYLPPGPFATPAAPVVVRDHACALPLAAISYRTGVRDVIVDAEIKNAGQIRVGLRTRGAAVLRIGGAIAVDRPFGAGRGDTLHFANATVTPGRVRIVARIAMSDESDTVQLNAWDDHGSPIRMYAPAPRSTGNVQVTHASEVGFPAPHSDSERTLFAAASLAVGRDRAAEYAVAERAKHTDAPPELQLLYGRAIEVARDLPDVQRIERARGAYEAVLATWPGAWEAVLSHAVTTGARRGHGEARIDMLRDLQASRTVAGSTNQPLLDAFEASVSAHAGLYDRASVALERARPQLAATRLWTPLETVVMGRVGADRVTTFCGRGPQLDRSRTDCYEALRAVGDHVSAAAELERLRRVWGGSSLLRAQELRDALDADNFAVAESVYEKMLPGERTLQALAAIHLNKFPPADLHAAELRQKLLDLAPVARDAPEVLAPLMRVLGDDPLRDLTPITRRVVDADRQNPFLPDAATAILYHSERYDILPNGVAHAVMLDVRRVRGTTDVDQNAQAEPPVLSGQRSMRVLRRRIFKRDGRILEPDQNPSAQQAYAELSQLEQGDAVEAVYEGWATVGASGDLGIDSPDLLPARTAVHEASIEVQMPANIAGSLWVHPLLGPPRDSKLQGKRVLRWAMHDHAERRLDSDAPKMDLSVGFSFATMQWSTVGTGMRETLAALEERNPEIDAWAHSVVQDSGSDPAERISRVVEAAGRAIREASPGVLSDFAFRVGRASDQRQTARTFLTSREGSRTWLVVRALQALAIPADVVVAENEPFSADPMYPPHFGRFTHPLAVAHLANGDNIWIDADVSGPPLPAGRLSPGLRGRGALFQNGTIEPLPHQASPFEWDDIDIALKVDSQGTARGEITITLRGREAQDIAEAFIRIVGEDRTRALRTMVLAWLPSATVLKVGLSSSEGSWQVALHAAVSIDGYARAERARSSQDQNRADYHLPGLDPIHVMFPRTYVGSLGTAYARQVSRGSALAIDESIGYRVHRRVELPNGVSVSRIPDSLDIKSESLEASRTVRADGSALDENFVLRISTATVQLTKYDAFVNDVHRIDDAFLSDTRVGWTSAH